MGNGGAMPARRPGIPPGRPTRHSPQCRKKVRAAALAAAMLAMPYLYFYDFPVLMIAIVFLSSMGLCDGFLAFELPRIVASSGLILAFLVAMPTGFVAATTRGGADRAARRRRMSWRGSCCNAEIRAGIADNCPEISYPAVAAAQHNPRGSRAPVRPGRARTMEIIIFLLIGAVAGWLAGLVVRGYGFGLIGNIVVGIVGAVIAGWLFPRLGIGLPAGTIGEIISAAIGAVILLVIIGLVRRV
jgi:uncharacterized membrane protein YeaQ/YmgE (transglycosylase-associated protein family)